jgi:hypothetical protein
MKTWVVGGLLRVLRWLGRDVAAEVTEGAKAGAAVKDLVAELVRMRQEVESAKVSATNAEQVLQERRVHVVFAARIPDRAKREAMLKALREVPEVKALVDALDEAWLGAVNELTHPQIEDRQRQWAAGRAEALAQVKAWVQ